jgi:hypothetical protein
MVMSIFPRVADVQAAKASPSELAGNKSLLLLFFRKEVLSSLCAALTCDGEPHYMPPRCVSRSHA